MGWDKVVATLPEAKALVWDGCHKIYLALDDAEVETFREYGYGDGTDDTQLLLIEQLDEAPLDVLDRWFDQSCGLRFIESVRSVPEGVDLNEGFERLIAQFEFEENEEDR